MRYTKADLLAWAAQHHWPYLVLSDSFCTSIYRWTDTKDTDRVRHGELAWRRLARNKERRLLAWKRIERWQELLAQQSA